MKMCPWWYKKRGLYWDCERINNDIFVWYIEVLWSKTIGLCKKLTIMFIITCNLQIVAIGLHNMNHLGPRFHLKILQFWVSYLFDWNVYVTRNVCFSEWVLHYTWLYKTVLDKQQSSAMLAKGNEIQPSLFWFIVYLWLVTYCNNANSVCLKFGY